MTGNVLIIGRETEARHRVLLDAAPDAMVLVDPGEEIVLMNIRAEKQFGYGRAELLGQNLEKIIPEGLGGLLASILRAGAEAPEQMSGKGSDFVEIEVTGRRKDGSEFPAGILLSPLEGPEGIQVIAAIRDITSRKRAEGDLLQRVKELSRSNEELGQFASIVSHDLQEPLRMVASYIQLLSIRYKGRLDADADEFISFAVDGARRMQALIRDVLAHSRVGTQGIILHPTSSEEALRHALLNLRGAIEESSAEVTHDCLPAVIADEMQLVQLFQNMIGNGIKYRGPGAPRIHIGVADNGGKDWIFSVQDNGLGIAPEHFERIFDMFQRLHRREEFSGTGIGLAICKKIVERHGGRIWVESQPGRGSIFRFTLARTEAMS